MSALLLNLVPPISATDSPTKVRPARMEVVASEDVGVGVAVTPWVKPLAHVLRQSLLLTHCSSCFGALVEANMGNSFPLTKLDGKIFPYDSLDRSCQIGENLYERGKFEEYVEEMIKIYRRVFDFERKIAGGSSFALYPLHVVLVSSYPRSASAFEKLGEKKLARGFQDEAEECLKKTRAFLLLYAGSLYYLFRKEASLLFLLADALFEVGKKLMIGTNDVFNVRDLGCQHLDSINLKFEEGPSPKCFDSTLKGMWECITRLSVKVWSHLIDHSHFLQSIPNPCDFSWLDHSILTQIDKQEDKKVNGNEVNGLYAELSIHCTIMAAYCQFIVDGPSNFEEHRAFLDGKFDFGDVNVTDPSLADVDAFNANIDSTEPKLSTTLASFGSSLDPYCAPSTVENGRYDYTRSGNPTRESLEKLLAKLDYADRAFCFTSGMAALTVVANLLESGQEIVVCNDIYEGPECLLSQVIPRKGIIVKRVKTTNLDEVTSAMGPKTKLVWLESPTYPLMQISDIKRISSIAHKYGALVLVDNSIMSPVLSQPLILGADIVLHSPAKFIAGHSDFMAGVLAVKGERLANDIANLQNAHGSGLAPCDCWLCSRGISTMALRVKAQQESAKKIAEFLACHQRVEKVNYAGLPDHPGRFLHFSQAIGASSALSFLTGSPALSKHIVESVKYLSIAFSFGSVKSLITLPYLMCDSSIPASDREARGLTEDLISISVGIEDVDDLIADLGKALSSESLLGDALFDVHTCTV